MEPGTKLDAGKPDLMLVTSLAPALEAVARVMEYGAAKYRRGGWLAVPNGEARYLNAALRHLLAHAHAVETGNADGLIDESGRPHIDHALTSLAMAVCLRARGDHG